MAAKLIAPLIIVSICVAFMIVNTLNYQKSRQQWALKEEKSYVAGSMIRAFQKTYCSSKYTDHKAILKFVRKETKNYRIRRDYENILYDVDEFMMYTYINDSDSIGRVWSWDFKKYMEKKKESDIDPLLAKYLPDEDKNEKSYYSL